MRFLADMGISVRTVGALNELGHDAVHAREIGLSRATDTTILERARSEGQVVLTVDLDFGQLLAASSQITPSVVIFRMRDQTPGFDHASPPSRDSGALERTRKRRHHPRRYRVRLLPIGR